MARVARFDEIEQAEQAATHLREEGYTVEVRRGTIDDDLDAVVLTSDDAAAEPFETAVVRRYGHVLENTAE